LAASEQKEREGRREPMTTPEGLRYSEDHEWVKVEDDVATVGITDYAQEELGDIVFVELPRVGTILKQGATLGVVESVKAVSDVYAPVSGAVLEVNSHLSDHPETINESPYEDGWLVRVSIADAGEIERLMTAEQYEAFTAVKKD
jgi:glycine cleavage system H protein